MIRAWFESHLSGAWDRLGKSSSKSGLFSELKNQWMVILYILGIVLMTAGIVNAVIQPVNFGYVIFPSSGAQSATETGVDALALLVGAAGIYISYRLEVQGGRISARGQTVSFAGHRGDTPGAGLELTLRSGRSCQCAGPSCP